MSRELLTELYFEAVKRVDPYAMIRAQASFSDGLLRFAAGSGADAPEIVIDMTRFSRILLCGAGKASAPMARAMEEVLEDFTGSIEGVVSVKYGHLAKTRIIELHEAGHPVPDENSLAAGDRIAALLEAADEKTLVINLISGGGSALLARPYPGLEYDAMREMTQVLLDCGADIHELNTLRKHCSGIKGGRMAQLAHPATLVNVLLSDVVGDDTEVIASGPGVADPSTFADAWRVLEKYQIQEKLPESIIKHLKSGLEDPSLETPKPDSALFTHVHTTVLGNNRAALEAAATLARKKGIDTRILSSQLTGEAREVAKVFAAMASEKQPSNSLILFGGETTVTIRGKGLGGRNQELALAYLSTLLEGKSGTSSSFLAAGSDGNDGPTDAAGGIITSEDVQRLRSAELPLAWLMNNDAYHYLDEHEILFRTGPTNTNVCDFCFLYTP